MVHGEQQLGCRSTCGSERADNGDNGEHNGLEEYNPAPCPPGLLLNPKAIGSRGPASTVRVALAPVIVAGVAPEQATTSAAV